MYVKMANKLKPSTTAVPDIMCEHVHVSYIYHKIFTQTEDVVLHLH